MTLHPHPEVVRHLQRYPWGTAEWKKAYGQRNQVESVNKGIKHTRFTDLESAAKRPGRGEAYQSIATPSWQSRTTFACSSELSCKSAGRRPSGGGSRGRSSPPRTWLMFGRQQPGRSHLPRSPKDSLAIKHKTSSPLEGLLVVGSGCGERGSWDSTAPKRQKEAAAAPISIEASHRLPIS